MNADTTDITETSTEASVPAVQAEAPPTAEAVTTEATVTHRSLAEWHGKELVDKDGERIGKLEDVYFLNLTILAVMDGKQVLGALGGVASAQGER